MDRRSSVDIQAKSRDEALRLALEQLGARSEDVTVEVLAEIENDFYGDGEVLLRVTRKGARVRPEPEPVSRQTVADDALEEYEQLAKDLVSELLEMMNVEADVVAVDNPSVMPVGADDPPTVFIDIMGNDLGLLIGRRGENLSQFQYLINLLLNRQTDDWVRAIVDVEGYRIRREESLIGLAERVGRQVARNRRAISLEPMPPNERRVVHLTLQNQPDVSTESSGDEPQRRVTITPN